MEKIFLNGLPKEWEKGAAEILPELGFEPDAAGIPVKVSQGDGLKVGKRCGKISITAGSKPEFFRALSHLKGVMNGKPNVEEKCGVGMLGLMGDCSRNAVLSVEGAKRMMRYLAILGFNSMQLYIEDTYEMEKYPYFGRLRGRFSKEELKELDDYAYDLGLELIPCIQTLAHLPGIMGWSEFSSYRDIGDIILADNDATYELIDEMIKTFAGTLRTKRINLGMDEAHMLGRGRFMDINGYKTPTEIMLKHLNRVVDICKSYGIAPMIWSDMFFRMAFGGQYYVSEGEISPEVMEKVPEGLTLIYWDYYSNEYTRARFAHMMKCHLKFPHNPTAFAGGSWTWSGFVPHTRFSVYSSRIQLQECAKAGMKDMFVTAWGDNGRECSLYCTLPTLLLYSEFAYAGEPDEQRLEVRMRECFDIGFEEMLTLDAPEDMAHRGNALADHPRNPAKYLLYNDPLEGKMDAHMEKENVSADFAAAEKRLLALAGHEKFGYLFKSLAALSHVLVRKSDFTVRLRDAYLAGDKAKMKELAAETDLIIKDIDTFRQLFRAAWMRENKPYGFGIQDLRIGGLKQRLAEAKVRIAEYLNEETARIPELEEPVLPFKNSDTPYINAGAWSSSATACMV